MKFERGDLVFLTLMDGAAADAEDQDDPWAISWDDVEMQGKEIGRGQFGAVFHGLLFGSEVAVKKLLKLTDAEADTKYMKREQVVGRVVGLFSCKRLPL